MSNTSEERNGLFAKIGRLLKFIHKELHQEGAYLLPLRIFIGTGWIRASLEKLLEPDWYDGTALAHFFSEQLEEGIVRFPFYVSLINDVFMPNVMWLAWIVIIGQMGAGLLIMTGAFTNFGLLGGLFMNLNFILVGRVNPSAFYVVIQLVLFIGNTGAVLGIDTFLTKRIRFFFLVAQSDYKRRFSKIERFTFLLLAMLCFAGSGYSFFFIQDFSPNSVDDPAMLLFILGTLTGMAMLIDFLRLTSPDREPPRIESPHDVAYVYGEVGKFIKWKVHDNNPDTYSIMKGTTVLKEGRWENGDEINFLLDGLEVGYHRIVLTVRDWFGNTNSDTVDVNIIDPLQSESNTLLRILQYYRDDLTDQKNHTDHQLKMVHQLRDDLQESVANMKEDTAEKIGAKYGNELEKLAIRQLYLETTVENLKYLIASVEYEQVKINQNGNGN